MTVQDTADLVGEVVELFAAHHERALLSFFEQSPFQGPGAEVVLWVDAAQQEGGRLLDGRRA